MVVGAFHGRERRAGTYGALLLAAYDPKEDVFKTVTKCGTGFTDKDLAKLPKIMEKHQVYHWHSRVVSTIDAEVWFEPKIVIETIGAEITLSPIPYVCHGCYPKRKWISYKVPALHRKLSAGQSPLGTPRRSKRLLRCIKAS